MTAMELPVDVWCDIADNYVEKKRDLSNLSMTCRHVREAAVPALFHEFSTYFERPWEYQDLDYIAMMELRVKRLEQRLHEFTKHARFLKYVHNLWLDDLIFDGQRENDNSHSSSCITDKFYFCSARCSNNTRLHRGLDTSRSPARAFRAHRYSPHPKQGL